MKPSVKGRIDVNVIFASVNHDHAEMNETTVTRACSMSGTNNFHFGPKEEELTSHGRFGVLEVKTVSGTRMHSGPVPHASVPKHE